MYVTYRPPAFGEMVGDYKVLELIGRGGLGAVFKVERGGRHYAMKFLLAPKLDGRAKREISILNHLDNPCVVRYVGSDFWPNPVTGYPYIVMEYVPGNTLETFAFIANPSARKGTRIILDVARTLGEVHGEGVFHRDLKPTNIVITGASERPVLIDFGIGALAGASCLTGAIIPPATEEYRPPDPLRFEREHPSGTSRYEFGPIDELWALGVTFYWLLTDELPFGERTDEGESEGLRHRILTRRPVPPHVGNPRVPLAASRVCMTMLAEWPAERFQNVPELCGALQAALSEADDDPAWDVPLMDPHDPQASTTDEDPARVEPNKELRAYRTQGKRRPRRGLVRRGEARASVAAPAPVAEPDQDRIPTVDAPGLAAGSGGDDLPGTVTPVQAAPGELELPAHVVTRAPLASWRLGLVAALLTVAFGVLYLSADAWGPGTSSPSGSEQARPMLPSTFAKFPATIEAAPGREMASTWEPPDSIFKVGAAPFWAQPPASPVIAMSPSLPQTPKTEAPKSQIQRTAFRLGFKSATVAAAVVACTGPGCTAANNQVRPDPKPIACPKGWESSHAQYKVYWTSHGTVALGGTRGEAGAESSIHEGDATAKVDSTQLGLPLNTVLFGTWQFGKDRVFATFTRAQIPGADILPVCLVVGLDAPDDTGCPAGLGQCPSPRSSGTNVKSFERIYLFPASKF